MRANMVDGAITGIYGWAVSYGGILSAGIATDPRVPARWILRARARDLTGNLHDRAVMDGGVTARKSRYDWMMDVGLSPPQRRGAELHSRTAAGASARSGMSCSGDRCNRRFSKRREHG